MPNEQLNYQGLSIALLLASQSGVQGDLLQLKKTGAQWTEENVKRLLRHALYFPEPAFKSGSFEPKEPSGPQTDPEIEDALAGVRYGHLLEQFEQFCLAGKAIELTVGPLLAYEGGSCPKAKAQPNLHINLKKFGASHP